MTALNTHNANSRDEELLFHFELDEPPRPVATVATFDEYLFSRHNDLESSQPAEGHALGRPRGSSHEPEPCKPSLLRFEYRHKLQPKPKVMAAQAMEALNRTFIELKSKNEEIRLRASYDLRDQVVSAARGKASCLACSSCTD